MQLLLGWGETWLIGFALAEPLTMIAFYSS